MNLAAKLDHQARRRPDHPAIIENGQFLTYRQLALTVRRWAACLLGMGFGQGDVIAVALRDTTDHIVANWAIARMGGILLPIDHLWTPREKRSVLEAFNARTVLIEPETNDTNGLVVDQDFRNAAAGQAHDIAFPEDDSLPFVLSLSSGTTGRPKGPVLTHAQMRARWITQFVSLGFTERDRYLSATPLYFGGGRSFTMSTTWSGGTVVMFPPPYQPRQLIEAAERTQATTLLLVPTMLRRLLKEPESGRCLFPSLRLLLSTGAVLHETERSEVMRRLCPAFINYYGSTEGGGVSVLTPQDGPEAAGSVGRAVFDVEVQIVDEDGNPVAEGTTGRIRYRGPGVATRTSVSPQSNPEAPAEEWFYPGDHGRMDSSGYLYLAGRRSDLIIRAGINIYPEEIEAVLLSCPGVVDAAVVDWPSPSHGQEIAAFVTGSVGDKEVMAHCIKHLARYKVPRAVICRADLPRSPLGKIRKDVLRDSLPAIDDSDA